jgi:prepilin-type N-terminal cleavage/methylation domain-containing protein
MNETRTGQCGFSLVELMIALVVTLIVSGAIYGLLASGQDAFRREPELADRQQNIRIAMDVIKADIANAGSGMSPFVQAFTPGLNGAGIMGSSGDPTDALEIVTTVSECPLVRGTAPADPAADPADSNEPMPGCFPVDPQGPQFFYVGGRASAEYGVFLGNAQAGTVAGAFPFNIGFVAPDEARIVPPDGYVQPAGDTFFMRADVVRYVVAVDPTEPGVPCLWRSRTGDWDSAGAPVPAPPGGNWQIVARGIEDLQVEYLTQGGWSADLAAIALNDVTNVVRQVEVTLSARALAPNLAGQTEAPGGPNAPRGALIAQVAPRAALAALNGAPGGPQWY